MTNATAIDVKKIALGSLEWGFKTLREDLEGLPEEAFDQHFGGKARTVADFMREVVLVNDHIRLTITGEPLFDWPEGWITAPEGERSKEVVCGSFNRSADAFLEAIRGFSEDQMMEPIQSEGKTTNRFERCRFVAWHAGYHSGQVNFIQTLLGDDGWHWT